MELLPIHPIALAGMGFVCYITGYYVGAVNMAIKIKERLKNEIRATKGTNRGS